MQGQFIDNCITGGIHPRDGDLRAHPAKFHHCQIKCSDR